MMICLDCFNVLSQGKGPADVKKSLSVRVERSYNEFVKTKSRWCGEMIRLLDDFNSQIRGHKWFLSCAHPNI